MLRINEKIDCYSKPEQRDLLIQLSLNQAIRENFFLTGGTALSVFYLHHRKSEDIDLFTVNNVKLDEIDFWILRKFDSAEKTGVSEFSVSYLINDVKLDIVSDKLSLNDFREKYDFDGKSWAYIDSVKNIASNKLCTLVSRTEIKDYLDFYFLCRNTDDAYFDKILVDAKNKDLVFEDLPTVGYQIERGYESVAKIDKVFYPEILIDFDSEDFKKFYIELTQRIYRKIN